MSRTEITNNELDKLRKYISKLEAKVKQQEYIINVYGNFIDDVCNKTCVSCDNPRKKVLK